MLLHLLAQHALLSFQCPYPPSIEEIACQQQGQYNYQATPPCFIEIWPHLYDKFLHIGIPVVSIGCILYLQGILSCWQIGISSAALLAIGKVPCICVVKSLQAVGIPLGRHPVVGERRETHIQGFLPLMYGHFTCFRREDSLGGIHLREGQLPLMIIRGHTYR